MLCPFIVETGDSLLSETIQTVSLQTEEMRG